MSVSSRSVRIRPYWNITQAIRLDNVIASTVAAVNAPAGTGRPTAACVAINPTQPVANNIQSQPS